MPLDSRYPHRTIDELATHVGSGLTPTGGARVYKPSGIMFIRSQNVHFDGLDLRDVAYIDRRTHESMARSEVFAADVLLNITGASIGRCCVHPGGLGSTNVNQHVCAIRLPGGSHADASFLSSVLASHLGQHQIDQLNSGSNREGLNYQQVRAFVVPWPEPEVRAAIAAILDTLDETIRKTEQIIAKLKQVKQGLLHDLLTRGIDDNGELRDPERHPQQFKDSVLGRIPRGWEVIQFGAVADCVDPQPDHRTPPHVPGGVPYIGVGDFLDDGTLDLQSCRRASERAARKQESRFGIQTGDILFGKIGTIGNPRYVPVSDRIALSANAILVKPRLVPEYIMALMESRQFARQIDDQIHTTSQPAFGIQKIRRLLVPRASATEESAIAEAFRTHRVRSRNEDQGLAKLRLLKSGLMEDLLTGRVRVTNLLAEVPHAP